MVAKAQPWTGIRQRFQRYWFDSPASLALCPIFSELTNIKSPTEDTQLSLLNSLASGEATAQFRKCCGSKNWARQMVEARPFAGVDQMIETADRIWWSLGADDWLEAFHSHPKIGEKKAAHAVSDESRAWSEQEQSGIQDSARDTIEALADLNSAYEKKFGFIFIVCAAGKSSEEMLAILRERLANDREKELRIAAAEQAKITELRIQKLVAPPLLP